MKIICTPEILEVSIGFLYEIQNEKFEKTIGSKLANTFDIPQMEFAAV